VTEHPQDAFMDLGARQGMVRSQVGEAPA